MDTNLQTLLHLLLDYQRVPSLLNAVPVKADQCCWGLSVHAPAGNATFH